MLNLKKFHHQGMDMNSYMLFDSEKAVIIDPGMNGQAIKDYLLSKNKSVEAVLLTHGHYDHIQGLDLLKDLLPFNVYVHERDLPMLYDASQNYSTAFGEEFRLRKIFRVVQVQHHSELTLIGNRFQVIHTPGHTPGSVMYQFQQNVFSGDTLFYDSIGRTDLFSGSFNAIRRSLKLIHQEISNGAKIYPGHGRFGKLKDIKRVNPFLNNH